MKCSKPTTHVKKKLCKVTVEEVEDEDSPTHLSTWNNEGAASSQNSQANRGATTSSTMEKPKVHPITEE